VSSDLIPQLFFPLTINTFSSTGAGRVCDLAPRTTANPQPLSRPQDDTDEYPESSQARPGQACTEPSRATRPVPGERACNRPPARPPEEPRPPPPPKTGNKGEMHSCLICPSTSHGAARRRRLRAPAEVARMCVRACGHRLPPPDGVEARAMIATRGEREGGRDQRSCDDVGCGTLPAS
jgi:hypothetical protein